MASHSTRVRTRPAVASRTGATIRRQQRRDSLYDVAITLMTDRGFDGTTMEDIAVGAGVARATVFNHFQRKADILDEWGGRRRGRAAAAVHAEHLDDHSLREILWRYLTELAAMSEAARPETVALMTASVQTMTFGAPSFFAVDLANLFLRARNRGEVAADLDIELAAHVLANSYFTVMSGWVRSEPAPFDLREKLLQVLDMLLSGVLAA